MDATEELPRVEAERILAGRYRLGRRLGAGGFGTVYAAIDERLDREVAVKVIPSDGPAPERARREAVAAARLDHPGIVALLDAGQDGPQRFLVCELVHGRTLSQIEAEGLLSDRDALRIGLALADALVHAHERGVIHRDIKPQNVLVPDQGRWPAKLADFGVAHLVGDEPLTVTGDVVGTLAYMSPEQAAGEHVDGESDLYSLGLLVFEALAGFNPIRGETPAQTARRLGTRLPSLRKARPDLPEELIAAIDRTLLPRPEDRGTLEDLADTLADCLYDVADEGSTIAPHPVEAITGPPGWVARGAHGLLTGALAAIALGPEWAAAAVPVALLPRLGWLATALAVVVALALDGRSGVALLVLAAALPVPLLLRGYGVTWSLAPLAALPVVAGQLRGALSRIGLGALGGWWLLLAFPPLEELPRRWESAASIAATDVLAPMVSTGAPVLCAVWAAFALVLPWIVRGHSLALDSVAAAVWAGALGAATASVAVWIGRPEPDNLAVAIAACAALAVVARRGLAIITPL